MTIELYMEENNDVFWFSDIHTHNKYGPAIIRLNGTKSWCVKGYLHRLDGPAIEWPNGTNAYWINGIEYTYLEYIVEIEQHKVSKETYDSNNKHAF